MFKRLFALAAVFLFLTAVLPAVAGQLIDAQTAINDALQNSGAYYEQNNQKGDSINYVSIPILSKYLKGDNYFGCLVYGGPHGDTKDSQSRYLGYTLSGEDYTNVAFPPDVSHSGYFEDQQWVYQPWWNSDVTTNYTVDFNNGLDGTDLYAQNIRQGILVYYTDPSNANNYQVKGVTSETQDFWDNIQQYIHVLAPPTDLAWGIGRMWRYGENGQINYVTVPIMPNMLLDNLDLLVVTPVSAIINVGDTQQYVATYSQSQGAGNGQDVTNFSNWVTANSSIAIIGANNGLATGKSAGATQVTATYAVNGKTLQGHAQLIVQEQQLPPPSNNTPGSLTFQAVSQDGSTSRAPGTAKWTDIVTANLVPPVMQSIAYSENMVEPDYSTTVAPPLPPSGGCAPAYTRITGWRIVGADLSYPKQNPEFTFGQPLPPIGDETISMDVSGRQKATASFKELWAMDGAYILDWFTDQLINQEPKNYNITASNITVQVEYNTVTFHEVCSDDGDCVCVSQTKSGSYMQQLSPITAQLLVNGTGVNSLAQ
ncbi:Ig-like domain-containing protein [Pelotomaculum schinkii]|uniref:Ig-like domain-containing protein n=1 Tax=Pelotomaculum schinkii TaxID=78350 RepID=UPI00167D8817|nr:Ig-like domain-containing protein [Pelotomaculum schinkii]